MSVLEKVLTFFYPKRCLLCGRAGAVNEDELCADCAKLQPDIRVRFFALHAGRRDYTLLPAIDKNRVWDCIVPVPISRERLKQRGYDQSVLLAKEVSKLTGIPFRTDILEKTKHNRTQHNLSAKEREANVRGAYRAEGAARLRILLLDDIVTTGATMWAVFRARRSIRPCKTGKSHVK